MRYKITDGIVEAVIDSHGAELISLKLLKNREEFMWNADPKFWGRTSEGRNISRNTIKNFREQ